MNTDTKAPHTAASTVANKPKRRTSWWWTGALLLVLLLAAYAGLRTHQTVQGQVSELLTKSQQQAQALQSLEREWAQQVGQSKQFQTDLHQQVTSLQERLRRQQRQLLSLSTLGRDDWLLAEAEYLIRLANQRLMVGKELAATRDLLQAADLILTELDDPALYPVRQALAAEMAALDAAHQPDIEGLYFQLTALAQQAQQLRLLTFSTPPSPTTAEQLAKPKSAVVHDGWRSRLTASWDAVVKKLSGAVQINHRDTAYQPPFPAQYVTALRQTLQLEFAQAEAALLLGEQTIYNASLVTIIQWLRNDYTVDSAAVDTLITRLEALRHTTISVTIPDISTSLHELKQFMASLPSPLLANIQPADTPSANTQSTMQVNDARAAIEKHVDDSAATETKSL